MGNWSGCCHNKNEDDINERTHILDNPVGSIDGINDSRYSRPSMSSPTYGTVSNGRNEQNQLNQTLHKLSAKVIDVSSIDTHLEQSDINERQRIYSQRLHNIKKPLPLKSKLMSSMASQFQHNRSLTNITTLESISSEDLELINYYSDKSCQALQNGFTVLNNESFVVQFEP